MSKQKKLLVVEDDVSIRELLEELFLSEDYEVHVAKHGADALDQLKAGVVKPDVIILDLSMAVMDGKTFLKEFPQQCPDLTSIPVLIMTAAGASEIPQHPTSQILKKPIDIDRLLETVGRFAGKV